MICVLVYILHHTPTASLYPTVHSRHNSGSKQPNCTHKHTTQWLPGCCWSVSIHAQHPKLYVLLVASQMFEYKPEDTDIKQMLWRHSHWKMGGVSCKLNHLLDFRLSKRKYKSLKKNWKHFKQEEAWELPATLPHNKRLLVIPIFRRWKQLEGLTSAECCLRNFVVPREFQNLKLSANWDDIIFNATSPQHRDSSPLCCQKRVFYQGGNTNTVL